MIADQVPAILDLVGLQEKTNRFPHELSGGQRQRIALARVFLREPNLLILDEVTSSLDAESESFVQKSLMQIKGSATMLIIAHRQSVIEIADFVYEIDEQGKLRKVDIQGATEVAV